MPVLKPLYGTSVAIPTTALATLASSALAGWQSGAVSNDVGLALGVLIRLTVTLAAGTPTVERAVQVYVYESEDGTVLNGGATGTEGLLTRQDPTNLRLLGTIACPTGGLAYVQIFTLAPPVMPRKWGLYVNNVTGLAFTAAAASYSPVQVQSA